MKFLILKMVVLALLYGGTTQMVVAATPVTITNIVSDSFNYPAGPLAPNAGGTGWTSAWQNNGHNSMQVTTPGVLTYPGVTPMGGQINWGGGPFQISDATRTLPAVNSGVVFVRFLAQFSAQSGGGTPNLRFLSGGIETGAIGGNSGCPGIYYSILNAPALSPVGCTGKSLAAMSLVLVQIDYTSSITKMWINPVLSSFDYLNPLAPDAQANLAPAIDQVSLYMRGGSFDELSIFRVTAAAPATAQPVPGLAWPSLLGLALGIALTVAALRRRQTHS